MIPLTSNVQLVLGSVRQDPRKKGQAKYPRISTDVGNPIARSSPLSTCFNRWQRFPSFFHRFRQGKSHTTFAGSKMNTGFVHCQNFGIGWACQNYPFSRFNYSLCINCFQFYSRHYHMIMININLNSWNVLNNNSRICKFQLILMKSICNANTCSNFLSILWFWESVVFVVLWRYYFREHFIFKAEWEISSNIHENYYLPTMNSNFNLGNRAVSERLLLHL